MTFAEIETLARLYAREGVSGTSQATIFTLINEAIVEFGRDSNGLPYEEYLALAESFDLEVTQAFHLTITGSSNNDIDSDIVVTSASASNQTGTQTATMLQAQIRAAIGAGADLTVVWSKFKFTVDAIDSTTIAIAEPDDSVTYTDYTAELFGSTQSETATEIECGFPQDCTIEATLTADSIRVNKVLWDDYILEQIMRESVIDPEITGTPSFYNVRGTKIRLVPVPSEQKKWYIEYKGVPAKVTSPTTTSSIPDIPVKYQRSLAYWVAKEILLGAFEDELGMQRYAEYKKIVNQYKLAYANNNTDTNRNKVPLIRFSVVDW